MVVAENRAQVSIAATRTPEDVALQRLRGFGLGLIVAAFAVDALGDQLARWRAFRTRLITGLDPQDRPATLFVEAAVSLLSSVDRAATKPSR